MPTYHKVLQPPTAFQLFPMEGLREHGSRTGGTLPEIPGLLGRNMNTTLNSSLINFIVDDTRHTLRKSKVCVIVVDMQGDPPSTWDPVIENQLVVLRSANRLNLPVFEARRATRENDSPTVTRIREVMRANPGHMEFTRTPGNSLEGTDEDGSVQFRELIQGLDIGTAIVMGQDANLCVANTIFGQEAPYFNVVPPSLAVNPRMRNRYAPGLLDVGISVLTSCDVTYTDSNQLDPIYTFSDVGNVVDIRRVPGIGGRLPLTQTPLDPTTQTQTDAALDATY